MSNHGVDMESIHNPEKNLERVMKAIGLSDMPESNKDILKRFHDECFSNNLSPTRVYFYMDRLYRLSKTLNKNFMKASKEELKSIIGDINKNKNYSEWTKHDYKVALRKLYQWLEGNEWNSKNILKGYHG